MRNPHRCHAKGCETCVPPRLLMCPMHWRMVPSALQAEVWRFYRRGQEVSKDPSPEYLTAMQAAIDYVALSEGK